MITCKDCKHWASKEPGGARDQTFRECTHPAMRQSELPYGDRRTDGIESMDGEMGFDTFASGPDFGCIHGETPKPSDGCALCHAGKDRILQGNPLIQVNCPICGSRA